MKTYFIFISLLLINSLSIKASKDNNEEKKTNGKIKPYEKVITPEYKTYSGMFKVHRNDDKLYFEIPDSLFSREFLIASQIAEVSDPDGGKGFAGELRRNPIVIRFSHDDKNVYILTPNNKETITDESGNIKNAFERNYLDPVLETFPIKATGNDSSIVIDVTDFFASELPIITPFASKGKPGKLDKASSFLDKVQVFEKNIELQSYFNYSTNSYPFRALLNRSIVLLPKETMMPRLSDRRINFFANSKKYFIDNGYTSVSESYIHRFKLEPKDKDVNNYLNGILVEPKKPIIVYVDNGLPERWKKYVMQGIEDWQKAFEACGFKNAIQAKAFPDDPNFNPDNLQNTCFRYIPNSKINAQGTRWIDPRSGEILKGDIYWFSDVIEKLHDWRLVQCGAVEEAARKKIYSDEMMGRLIRYAVAHEMGHTLGFQHNMRASYAFPVDSLRSTSFTDKYGSTPSIMDYARNNYIAQPGDNITALAPPLLGEYDIFAVEYGYKWLPDINKPSEEYEYLNQMLLTHTDDPTFRFTPQFAMGISGDPSAQAESLGDDAVKAGTYGIKNLKYITDHLVEWCTEPNKEYDYLRQIYKEVSKQYERYLKHSMSYIGGAYQYFGVEGENVPLYTPVKKEKQLEAIKWIVNEIAQSKWLLNKDIEDRLGSLKNDYYKLIVGSLDQMMSGYFFQRIETYRPIFSSKEYLSELSNIIWGLSKDGDLSETDIILQQAYVHNLINIAYGSKNHLKSNHSSNLIDENINYEESLASGNAAKINFVDHFAVMAALDKLDKAEKYVKRKMKGANKAHYTLLYKTIKTNN